MKLSEQLKTLGAPILQETFRHPFIQGMAEGMLPKQALIFYVAQDALYLREFVKVYAFAVAKSETPEDARFFEKRIRYILDYEVNAHNVFCEVAGVKYEDIQRDRLAPAAMLYIQFLLLNAQNGSLLDILASVLPCMWCYWEIANYLYPIVHAQENHPFREWVDMYAEKDVPETICDQLFGKLEEKAQSANEQQLENVKRLFLTGCELEWGCWDMAYQQQDWKFI